MHIDIYKAINSYDVSFKARTQCRWVPISSCIFIVTEPYSNLSSAIECMEN